MDSYLSPNVRQLICVDGLSAVCQDADKNERVYKYVNPETKLLNLGVLDELCHSFRLVDPAEETPPYFINCVKGLADLFEEVESCCQSLTMNELCGYFLPFTRWLSDQELFSRCLEILTANLAESTTSYHSVLLLSLILERSLGDLVLLRCKLYPSLLRDLLLMKELKQLLSDSLIWLLRVLIGPPISLNLRNVAWHGFFSPNELHLRYCYVIVCVIGTIGHWIKAQRGLSEIPHRNFIDVNTESCFSVSLSREEYEQILGCSSLIPHSLLQFWHLGSTLHDESRYGESCVVLLPVLESSLRHLYVTVNKCPHRLQTAELTAGHYYEESMRLLKNSEFFTTMEEILGLKGLNKLLSGLEPLPILCSSLENGQRNKIRDYIGESHLAMLLDLFTYPGGRRLRDRMSHGEVRLTGVSRSTSHRLISLCVSMALLFTEESARKQFDEQLVSKLKILSTESDAYESVFHPLAILKIKISETAEELTSMTLLPIDRENGLSALLPSSENLKSSVAESYIQPWVTSFDEFISRSDQKSFQEGGNKNSGLNLSEILKPNTEITKSISSILNSRKFVTNFRYAQAEAKILDQSNILKQKELVKMKHIPRQHKAVKQNSKKCMDEKNVNNTEDLSVIGNACGKSKSHINIADELSKVKLLENSELSEISMENPNQLSRDDSSTNSVADNNSCGWSGEKERELIGQLIRCCQISCQCSKEICREVKEKHEQWQRKELRSRQRATVQRLVLCLPYLSAGLRFILYQIISLYVHCIPSHNGLTQYSCTEAVHSKSVVNDVKSGDNGNDARSKNTPHIINTADLQYRISRHVKYVEQTLDKLFSSILESKWEESRSLIDNLLLRTTKLTVM